MSVKLLPPDSSLIGIALVVRSKEGPRFVFHYPPHVREPAKVYQRYGTELAPTTPDESEDDDDDNDLEDEDTSDLRKEFDKINVGGRGSRHVNPYDGDDHFEADGIQIAPWHHLDGFPTSELASILTPAKAYHKKCFELSLDPLVYVTYPIHIRDDGLWKKPKRTRKRSRKHSVAENTDTDTVVGVSTALEGSPEPKEQKDEPQPSTSFVSEDGGESGMTMFNLVFIMHAKPQEAAIRIKDMYDNVAKDMNKALKYAQHYNSYVWTESEKILAMKEKAKEDRLPMSILWTSILEKSTLASAMRDTFQAITKNEIATIRLTSDPPVRLAVQIPTAFFLTEPPTNHQAAMPGLWITTANHVSDDFEDDGELLSKDFALLLMDDEAKIMAEIQQDGGQLAGPLLKYLAITKDTLSFQQVATAHSIQLGDIRVLAQHLIYYRRAIAVPPLHGRDTYVMNPNSDNHKLPLASIQWSKTFALAPPLTTFLADLSKTPKPYKLWAPSKDHRQTYLRMLAWLLRGGWVTQLRTFAWIIVWPEIRYEVDYELDKTRLKKIYEDTVQDSVDEARAQATESPSSPSTTAQTAEKARITRAREKIKQDWVDFQKRPLPIASADPSIIDENTPAHIKRVHVTTIVNPATPSTEDSLYLQAISKRLPDDYSRKMWVKFAKYFNGQVALEMIALKENIKRKEVAALLSTFDEFLLISRHW